MRLIKYFGVKEIWTSIVKGEVLRFFFTCHNGLQLKHIAKEEHLNSAERVVGSSPSQPKHLVIAIHQIGADHLHFVDHDRIE